MFEGGRSGDAFLGVEVQHFFEEGEGLVGHVGSVVLEEVLLESA